jgi:transmembrane sensor
MLDFFGGGELLKKCLSSDKHLALQEAAHWHAELGQTPCPAEIIAAWKSWLDTSPQNRWAWQKVECLTQQLEGLPSNLSFQALESSEKLASTQRRSLLKSVLGIAAVGGAGWAGFNAVYSSRLLADYHTSTGETKEFKLTDGSKLTLNTATAVDFDFNDKQRLIDLKQGEVMVETSKDFDSRPFYVQTRDGLFQALGTRFSVFQDKHLTVLSVYEHRVALLENKQRMTVCMAGQKMHFRRQKLILTRPLNGTESSWTQSIFVADDLPVDQFIANLSRYRAGIISCEPDLNQFRISGTFDLRDTDQALRAISQAFPVKIHYLSPYWVRVTRI